MTEGIIAERSVAAAAANTSADTPSRHHRVSAIYPSRDEADAVRATLIQAGFAASALEVLHADALPGASESSDETLKLALVDGAIGTAVGTGVGALGTLALWASGMSLFVASPVIAPLAMLGWFAGIGAVVGAVAGVNTQEHAGQRKEGRFSELVMDAIKAGHAVLVAHASDDTERRTAEKIVRDSLKGRDEDALKSE